MVRSLRNGVFSVALRGHSDAVRALCVAGSHLYSAGDDGHVLRWQFDGNGNPTGTYDVIHQGLRGSICALVDAKERIAFAGARVARLFFLLFLNNVLLLLLSEANLVYALHSGRREQIVLRAHTGTVTSLVSRTDASNVLCRLCVCLLFLF